MTDRPVDGASLLDMWHQHLVRATVAQFCCERSMQDHLDSFQSQVVATAFTGTKVAQQDVLDMLAAMTSSTISVPKAGALTLIAERARRMIALQIAHDACQLAKEKAARGWTYVKVNTDELSCGKHLNQMNDSFRLEALRAASKLLKDAGFKRHGHSDEGLFQYKPNRMDKQSFLTFRWS